MALEVMRANTHKSNENDDDNKRQQHKVSDTCRVKESKLTMGGCNNKP